MSRRRHKPEPDPVRRFPLGPLLVLAVVVVLGLGLDASGAEGALGDWLLARGIEYLEPIADTQGVGL